MRATANRIVYMVNKEALSRGSSAWLHPDPQTWSVLETREHGGRVRPAHVALLRWGHRCPAGLGLCQPLWLCGAVVPPAAGSSELCTCPPWGTNRAGHARSLLTSQAHWHVFLARSHTPNCTLMLKQLLRDSQSEMH